MTPAEKWANTKNANDSTTKKAIKAITRGGQFMLNNPGYIVGTQLGIVATGVGSAYADYKLSKPKPKGLTPPTKKSINKVLDRSTMRQARDMNTDFKNIMSEKRNPKQEYYSRKSYVKEQRLYNNKRVKMDSVQKQNRQFKIAMKTIAKDHVKNVGESFVKKTMGNIKKLTPAGLVGAIMQPKKVGDATLYGNQGEYKKVK